MAIPRIPGVTDPQSPPMSVGPLPKKGGGLNGLLSMAGPIGSAIGGAIDFAGPLIDLFKPNKEKQAAASLQQLLEKQAMEIQQAVNSGQMDPDAALIQLQGLQERTGSIGGTPELQQAGQRANIIISNVMMGISSQRTNKLNDWFTAPQNKQTLGGSSQFQKERLQSGIRNALAGTDVGQDFANQSPIYNQLINPVKSPFERFGQAQDLVGKLPQIGSVKKPLREDKY